MLLQFIYPNYIEKLFIFSEYLKKQNYLQLAVLGDSIKNYGMNSVCSGTIMVYFMAYQACVTSN